MTTEKEKRPEDFVPTLYADRLATTCRPIFLFAADQGIDFEVIEVELAAGDHLTDTFARLNPNKAVPVLVEDSFVLTECSAVLKYLADIHAAPAYPTAPRARAKVNQWMDWFVTLFAQDYNYGQVYSRVLPQYALSEPGESERRAFTLPRARARLSVLDAVLGETGAFICGAEISLADYLGVCFVTLGELVDFDLMPWPNVRRWVADIKARPAWAATSGPFYAWRDHYRASLRGAA
jgi:glutathione S-transferase